MPIIINCYNALFISLKVVYYDCENLIAHYLELSHNIFNNLI